MIFSSIGTAIFGADFILIFIADVYLYICDYAPSKVNHIRKQKHHTTTLTPITLHRHSPFGFDSKSFDFSLSTLLYCHICIECCVCLPIYIQMGMDRKSIYQIHSELFRIGKYLHKSLFLCERPIAQELSRRCFFFSRKALHERENRTRKSLWKSFCMGTKKNGSKIAGGVRI